MQLVYALKIATIFEIFFISLAGFLIPVKFCSSTTLKSDGFRLLKSFSAGIIFGVGILHLLNDSVEELSESFDYPLSLALFAVGVLLTLALEQFSMQQLKSKEIALNRPVSRSSVSGPFSVGLKRPLSDQLKNEKAEEGVVASSPSSSNSVDDEMDEPTKMQELLYESIKTPFYRKALVKAVLLEVSVAVHSMIIGFDLGTIGQDEQVSLEILMVAFAFHQFFEGISLGTAITETSLPMSIKYVFACTFACTFPVGIVIGLLSSSSASSHSSVIIQGCANALAAGSLLYSSLVEMIAEDFADSEIDNRGDLKFKMLMMVVLGCLTMAILAIWA